MSKVKTINEKYNPSEIEAKWQKKWEEGKIYSPNLDNAKTPFYNLMMFPYPSAEGMHVGNMYAFTGADVYGRFKRMQGFSVFEPIGLDGFGIHSENYAIKAGKHPASQAKISEIKFYRQLHSIGNGFDWTRTVETYKPEYYKWTQWLFIQLFKAGLAYKKKAPVNFCPSCKTVLADEQVLDGKCERCETEIKKRELEQWFFKITKYADRLLANIDKLDWSEKVKIAQKQWIGKSEGTLIKFRIESLNKDLEVFTTRADTLYGATFLVLAPEHPISISVKDEKIQKYIKKAKEKANQERLAADRDKTGIFSGLYAINPINDEKIPVWIADYALMDFGTGALFGDAHDERDVTFAKKYDIPLNPTLRTGDPDKDKRIKNLEECFTGYGILFDSGKFSGLTSKEAITKITSWLEGKDVGRKETTYHLRDWLISRQRYWGPPIPMIYCTKCKWQPVPEDQLPVELPFIEDYKPLGIHSTSSGQAVQAPLASHPEFYETRCPKCGGEAKRETDVSDTFLDSAWYFLRYVSNDIDNAAFDIKRVKKWLPVAMYIGGAEHSVLHLLYSRFVTMVLKDMGLIDIEEPYSRFYAHGLIIKDGAKMSKSKGNVISPDDYLVKYGADTLRAYLRFLGPFNMGGDFKDSGIESMHRFLRRIWTFVTTGKFVKKSPIDLYLNKLIQEITEEMENLRFNTAFSRIMMYYNFLVKKQEKFGVYKEEILIFIRILAPFVPFLAEELWRFIGEDYSVHTKPWPSYDKSRAEYDYDVTIAVQINGKTRGIIDGNRGMIQEEIEQIARESANIKKYLEGKRIKKVIYVEGRVVNFVLNS